MDTTMIMAQRTRRALRFEPVGERRAGHAARVRRYLKHRERQQVARDLRRGDL
jgi:hypothetical protein